MVNSRCLNNSTRKREIRNLFLASIVLVSSLEAYSLTEIDKLLQNAEKKSGAKSPDEEAKSSKPPKTKEKKDDGVKGKQPADKQQKSDPFLKDKPTPTMPDEKSVTDSSPPEPNYKAVPKPEDSYKQGYKEEELIEKLHEQSKANASGIEPNSSDPTPSKSVVKKVLPPVQKSPNTKTYGKAAPVKEIKIERVQDDRAIYNHAAIGKPLPRFMVGDVVKDTQGREEKVKYVMVSRGGWIIRTMQPLIDRLSVAAMRNDQPTLINPLIEMYRTFNYVALLLTTDDGSEAMYQRLSEAMEIHRVAVSKLQLRWLDKTIEINNLFERYISVAHFRDINDSIQYIPAGSLKGSNYQALKDIEEQININPGRDEDIFSRFIGE